MILITQKINLEAQNKDYSKNYLIAVVQGLFVTVLWSSSWLLIKWGLEDENIPPLIFSGLRYFFASIVLLAYFLIRSDSKKELVKLTYSDLRNILVYGLFFITFTQGGMFLSLFFLEAITVSLILNFTIIAVIALSLIFLKETINKFQLSFVGIALIGVIFYFDDKLSLEFEIIGLIIAILAMFANAGSSILGRSINRTKKIGVLLVTTLSMLFGSIVLLFIALLSEKFPIFSLTSVIYILWLSVVNTALAFTIWNKSLQNLRAVDSTLINSTMTPQIVFLSVLFLGEHPNFLDWIGIIMVITSVIAIQLNQAKNSNNKS